MSLLDNLPHRVTARHRKRASDGIMGSVDTFDRVLFTNKTCWRQPATDREVHYWAQRSLEITNRFFFNEDPGVDENCVLDQGGYRFDVISHAEPDDSAGLGILWRVMVRKIGRIP